MFWALWGTSGSPEPPWKPWVLPLGLPWAAWGLPGTPWAPEDPRGQKIYTQTPDQPPEMAATSIEVQRPNNYSPTAGQPLKLRLGTFWLGFYGGKGSIKDGFILRSHFCLPTPS